jgi:hypothetical protein
VEIASTDGRGLNLVARDRGQADEVLAALSR